MIDRTFLALDLSTPRGDLAVLRGGDVLFEESFQSERSHNAQAFAPLRRALDAAGETPHCIVIGTGPGSYTGVRIAIAIAQGLSLSLGARVIGWPSIAAPNQEHGTFRVIGDARRGAFYVATVSDGRLRGEIELLSADEARLRLEEETAAPWLTYDAKIPFESARIERAHPSAVRLAQLALALPEAELHDLETPSLQPLYLQEAFITTARKPGKQVANP